jgi:uncharacterized protein with FMN-binding domain
MKKTAIKVVKKTLKIVAIVLAVLVLGFAGFCVFLFMGKEKTNNLSIQVVNLESIADGAYAGSYEGFRFSNKVEVTVKDHIITGIEIKKPVLFMKEKTSDQLIDEVKASQNTDVDVISGATVSSKAVLKAVENALE